MGDRCYVTLIVPRVHQDTVARISETYDGAPDIYNHTDDLVEFGFESVNWGTLPFLDELQEQGIAYSSVWSGGDEYGPGEQALRFYPDGSARVTEVSDEYLNPDINQLLKIIDETTEPEDRLSRLQTFILEHKEATTNLSWENQVEYGKIHRAARLIGAASP